MLGVRFPLHSLSSSISHPSDFLFFNQLNNVPNYSHPSKSKFKLKHPRSHHYNIIKSLKEDSKPSPEKSKLRTLFPGGYKRPEIKVPNIVLQLNAAEVLSDGSVVDFVDLAVAEWVGIVVINGGEESGGKLYEAACLLKSVIRDRAYLLVAERVDIAAAVNASGVLLSDQGLPPIVARNTLMSSKSESIVLPVVGRTVQTVNAALQASSAEGADFLVYTSTVLDEQEEPISANLFINSIYENVKIPVFIEMGFLTDFDQVSKVLMSGARGLSVSLEELKSSGDALSKILYGQSSQDEVSAIDKLNSNISTNGIPDVGLSSFVQIEDREVQFIRKEKRLLVEAVNAIEKAAPLMEEISLLNDAISQLEEPFLLVIVVIECSTSRKFWFKDNMGISSKIQ